jgi:vacuolar protein sorting-associated protein 18
MWVDIEIPRKTDRVHQIFVDDSATHALISLQSGENYHLEVSYREPKLLGKLKGLVISSVSWVKRRGEKKTDRCLFGTTTGALYETSLDPKDKTIRKILELDGGSNITGITVQQLPDERSGELMWSVLLATASRLYPFRGAGSLEEVLRSGADVQFKELPAELETSELRVREATASDPLTKFAWLTGVGVLYGDVPQEDDASLGSAKLLSYPATAGSKPPVSMLLTEFHLLLLYASPARLVSVSTLSGEVVSEEVIPAAWGPVRGMSADNAVQHGMCSVWLYTETSLAEIVVNNEDRYVWRLYMERKLWDTALEFTHHGHEKDIILRARADHHWKQEQFTLAASVYASTKASFEGIVLKFLNSGHMDALRVFLQEKLKVLGKEQKTKEGQPAQPQQTMLAMWLCELYLDQLDTAAPAELPGIQAEFFAWLKIYLHVLDKATVFTLLSSHGRMHEMVEFAQLVGDHSRLLHYLLSEKRYEDAVEALRRANSVEMITQFSPDLIVPCPQLIIDLWLSIPSINPRGLLPALMRYHASHHPTGAKNLAAKYLSTVIDRGCKDHAVHNYYITLLASEKEQRLLLLFLDRTKANPCFDKEYALRLCFQQGLHHACVLIYRAMGLFAEAVDLALQLDVELAKLNADAADEEEDRKKLWLRIAKHVVQVQEDIPASMDLLAESQLLRIEDILPFFQDFVRIDQFKDEICSSLRDYNTHIEDLRANMEDATQSADMLRSDIRDLKHRRATLAATQKCDHCGKALLSRRFFLFPCSHGWHSDCILVVWKGLLRGNSRSDIVQLQTGALDGKIEDERRLEDMVSSECALCGEVMIDSIDMPFIQDSDQAEALTWKL